MSTQWNPAALLTIDEKTEVSNEFAVFVLNQPIRNVTVFLSVCSRAQMVVAADGGANQIKDLYLNESRLRTCMPKAIVGDLDSLREDVRAYFVERGVLIKQSPDQFSTDFGKCLEYLHDTRQAEGAASSKPLDIVAFGGLGGRADHAFGQINELFIASLSRSLDQGRLFLLTAKSIMFVLNNGHNVISTPMTPKTFAENVGIIPVGRPAVISTKGLEWDVDDWETEFGKQISTSNHIRSNRVEVQTSERVLFTMEFALKPHP